MGEAWELAMLKLGVPNSSQVSSLARKFTPDCLRRQILKEKKTEALLKETLKKLKGLQDNYNNMEARIAAHVANPKGRCHHDKDLSECKKAIRALHSMDASLAAGTAHAPSGDT